MFKKMFILWIFFIAEALAIDDNRICARNQTILEIPGDAMLTVLLDIHFGPYCNESTPKAFQEIAAAFYLTTNLNKNNYVPGISLGLKIVDTCQDFITVYKRSLMLAAETNCGNSYNYSLGVLVPDSYISVLRPLEQFTDLPVTYFYYENSTKALVNIAVDFVSKRFSAIDLLLTESSETLRHFLVSTEAAGLCVQSLNHVQELQNKKEALIVIAAGEEFIRSWVGRQVEQEIRTTWIVLPMDDSEIDDILPVGSYLITPEFLFSDEENIDNDDLEAAGAAAVHSPYILSIGKALIPIVKLLFNLQHRNCQSGTCLLPHFDSKLLERVTNKQVLDALQVPEDQQTIKYAVFHKTQPGVEDMEAVATYDVDVSSYQVKINDSRERLWPCDSKNQCRDCVNFQKLEKTVKDTYSRANSTVKPVVKGYLKAGVWILVILVFIACGTVVCLVIGSFILFRFIVDEVLDGNPMLTFLIILGNIMVLQSAVPFCLEEDFFGGERLNAVKIFVTVVSVAFVLSLMLSRALFLALSTGGIFNSHINGYLQGLLGLFMFAVQLGMSIMYLVIGPTNVLHSPVFIALLSYDIFLLVALFGVSSFICKVPRNYREGKCFFFTALSLFALWLVWITTFLFMKPTYRDTVISAGLISSAYVIITGVLLPRVYYMITRLDRKKDFKGHIPDGEMAIHTRRTSARQSRRPFYEYVLPMEGGLNTTVVRESSHPNFYGGTSPNHHRQRSSGTISSVESKGFNNYGYQSEMQESENHYIVPRVSIEHQTSKKSTKFSDPDYAQPTYASQAGSIYDDESCIESEIYVDTVRLSPNRIKSPNEMFPSRCSSPRLYQTEATIDEEDEDDDPQATTKITRF